MKKVLDELIQRKRIYIQGIVQGVGFRPYVYKLAQQFFLSGWVLNDSFGVTVEVQGGAKALDDFAARLKENPPVLAQITGFISETIPLRNELGFTIKESRRQANKFTLISPDISICDDCLGELFDSSDRRYRYPFINCTNCGPRFTIIRDIPYDRPHTTMSDFRMCEACRSEYEDPGNRRFHAQPNACPVCGPHIWLADSAGNTMEGDPLSGAIQFLKDGKIVAIKGLGGFHLAVDATREEAVQRLRLRKHRYEKPLALMSGHVELIERYAEVSETEGNILRSPRRPICLLRKKDIPLIAPSVSPDNDYLGVMLPYTPLHYLLMTEGKFTALVMTSGNISEEPIVKNNQDALERLDGIADYFLLHNRDIHRRADDSVARLVKGNIAYVRRSRGFVPHPVITKAELPSVLSVGGELKNTICLNKGRLFFLSQHIGDLENLETLHYFEQSIQHLQKILEITPAGLAYDLHPEYLSTKWALRRQELPVFGIQHHHAHIASCMAEKGLTGRVIGFSLDGTGYGPDGTIWGGEVLVADERDYTRLARLETVAMPGGEKAIKEPWRMAVAYCRECGIELDTAKHFPNVTQQESALVSQMLERGFNSPLTSSCGRLFDAVAALAGLRYRVGYEGQAAMQLEAAMGHTALNHSKFYVFNLQETDNLILIDWKPLFDQLMNDIKNNLPASQISRKFHVGLIHVFVKLSHRIRDLTGENRVVLSGGCFQNRFLTECFAEKLLEKRFQVFYHTVVPPNDGGLSLGQAYLAAHRLKEEKMT